MVERSGIKVPGKVVGTVFYGPQTMFGDEVRASLKATKSTGVAEQRGDSLAWSELYLLFGTIFAKLDMRIHNTRYALLPSTLSLSKPAG